MRASRTHDVDPRAFRESMGHYASGITLVTSADDQGPVGFTCQSFYSVSAEPPLVSISVMKTSTTYPRIRKTGRFAVNMLSDLQQPLSYQFAQRGSDKWAGVRWTPTIAGDPIIAGTVAWVDCEISAEHDAGDHVIVLGRVVETGTTDGSRPPLLYFRGRYRSLATEAPPAEIQSRSVSTT